MVLLQLMQMNKQLIEMTLSIIFSWSNAMITDMIIAVLLIDKLFVDETFIVEFIKILFEISKQIERDIFQLRICLTKK
jgi:hypothetical protein